MVTSEYNNSVFSILTDSEALKLLPLDDLQKRHMRDKPASTLAIAGPPLLAIFLYFDQPQGWAISCSRTRSSTHHPHLL